MTGDWTEGPMVGFDLETTGVDVERDRIVQFTIVIARPDRDPLYVDGLVNPGIPIPDGSSDIHGITKARAREDGAPRTEALPTILHTLGRAVSKGWPIVAMNGAYDLTLLDRELWRVGLPALETYARRPARLIDPLVLDRHLLDRYRATKEAVGRTLTHLAALYAVKQGQHTMRLAMSRPPCDWYLPSPPGTRSWCAWAWTNCTGTSSTRTVSGLSTSANGQVSTRQSTPTGP